MSHDRQAPQRTGWWIASSAVLALAALSLMDLGNNAYGGFIASSGTQVIQVRPDSPAEKAGMQVGDRILVNAGIDTKDLPTLFRQPRPEVGETRHYVVERQGAAEPLDLTVTFTELPGSVVALAYSAALIGLTFLVCGVGIYLRWPNSASRLLALLGLAGMVTFGALPYIPQPDLRLAASLVPLVATLLMPALLVHFLLRFPRRRAFLDRQIALALLYGPVAVAGAVAGVALLLRPQLVAIATAVVGGVAVAQILWAVGVLVRSTVKASRSERAAYGLNALLIGFVGGLLPVVVVNVAASLPGAQFYFLTTILIPISLAYAALRAAGEQLGESRSLPVQSGVRAGANPWIDVAGSSRDRSG